MQMYRVVVCSVEMRGNLHGKTVEMKLGIRLGMGLGIRLGMNWE